MIEKIKIPKDQIVWESLHATDGHLAQIITSDELKRKWFLYNVENGKAIKTETGDSPKFKNRLF